MEKQKGLSSFEAAQRLKRFGPNVLPSAERRSLGGIVWGVVRQPMFALLLGGAVIYLLVGEALDAIVLAAFATLSVSIGIVQESRSEKVLESLRSMASPHALVVRDGKQQRIPARELVPGDLILLSEGDRVPADAVLVSGDGLMADESLLTGESVPVRKKIALEGYAHAPPGGEDLPFAFAGTLIVRGTGTASVTATGLHSEMGKIGQALASITLEQPRLRRQLHWLVRDFAVGAFLVAGLVLLLLGFSRGSWLNAGLGAIAVGMSMLPEEIPLVLAVFMAMGAWRISRAGVLTRNAGAIETLGSATVLCTDKTGTLTENHMRVVLVAADGQEWRPNNKLSETCEAVLHGALGASAPLATDPMDRAIHEAALAAELAMSENLLHSYGLMPELTATTNIWNGPQESSAIAYAKGAPETVADLCGLSPDARADLIDKVDRFACEGIRLLAVAQVHLAWHGGSRPKSQRDIPFHYLGLIGFADPLRETVPAAVAECQRAGIRVVMITGDYPATARAIASQAGIDSRTVITGDALEAMSDAALAESIRQTNIFARIRPGQKLRLVEALKRDGEIVAMTGDGVNDAPAMKAAHIGISMGGRGTDVAREASALVLLKDDFASIVATIRLGRRIYDNLRKAIEYIVAVHIPIAGLALLPLVSGLPLMLMPVQIALLEMLIDPACSIVFESEKEEVDVMQRPPRPPDMPVLPGRQFFWAMLQGLVAFVVVAAVLLLGARFQMPEANLRGLVFSVLVLVNIGLILVNRSFHASLQDVARPNRALWSLVAAVLLVLSLALYWPPAQEAFHFAPLDWRHLLVAFSAGLLSTGFLEVAKRLQRFTA